MHGENQSSKKCLSPVNAIAGIFTLAVIDSCVMFFDPFSDSYFCLAFVATTTAALNLANASYLNFYFYSNECM